MYIAGSQKRQHGTGGGFFCAELSAPLNAFAPHELQRVLGNKPSSQVRYHWRSEAAKALWNNGFGTAEKKVLTLLALSVSYRHESTPLPGLR
jgi:hypothetical protein